MNRWGRADAGKSRLKGSRTPLVTATRGERGRFGDSGERPGADVVSKTREAGLRAAAKELGIREVTVLGYPDGGLDSIDQEPRRKPSPAIFAASGRTSS